MAVRPDVSPDAVVDFDHHSDEFNQNELAINADLRRRCPVAWNENYGGFWFVSGYDEVSPDRPGRRNVRAQIRPRCRRRRELPG